MESGETDAPAAPTPEGLNRRTIMSTFTQIYYHVVFSTKARERVLVEKDREEFFRYTWGIIRNKDSHLYRINAVEDYVHILTSLHPSVALATSSKTSKSQRAFGLRRSDYSTDLPAGRRVTAVSLL